MKNTILEGLRAKFPGVSNSILTRIAEKIIETGVNTEEAATQAVEKLTFQEVLDSYGDSRATEASTTARANYEKKYNLKDGKPIEQPGGPTGGEPGKGKKDDDDDDVPTWAKDLIEQNKALQKRIADIDGASISKTRREKLKTTLSEAKAPAKIMERYEKDLDRMSFKDEDEYAAWLTEVKTDTEALVAETAVKGATFTRPPSGGGSTGDKPSPEVEARIKARAEQQAPTAIQGLPTNGK